MKETVMGQKQREVKLFIADGEIKKAIATGNNSAWVCQCGRKEPLLGKSGSLKGPSAKLIVYCPECNRKYFIVPEDKDWGRVKEVKELV